MPRTILLGVLLAAGFVAFLGIRPVQPWILWLVAGLTALACDGIVRSHPRWHDPSLLGSVVYLFLPATAVLGAGFFIHEAVDGYARTALGIVSAILVAAVVFGEYHTVDGGSRLYGSVRLAMAVVTHLTAFALYTILFREDIGLWPGVVLCALVSMALALEVLRESRLFGLNALVAAAAVGISVGELRLALYFFPLDELLAGGASDHRFLPRDGARPSPSRPRSRARHGSRVPAGGRRRHSRGRGDAGRGIDRPVTLTICSWNVNGLRARVDSLRGWLESSRPDIAGLQEVKATESQVDIAVWRDLGFNDFWHTAERPGYSGALLLFREAPLAIKAGLGVPEFDGEGRVIEAVFPGFTLLTSYFPNGGSKGVRLDFKFAFYQAFLDRIEAIRAGGQPVIFMGDLNIAHTEIDVARPQEAIKGTGFLPEERAWLDRYAAVGYVDTFRHFYPDRRDAYTYWEPWRERRARNIGWRIDAVWTSPEIVSRVRRAFIQPEIMGSDHCPVGIELETPEG